MKTLTGTARTAIMAVTMIFCLACVTVAQGAQKFDSCTLLTKAEIQAAIGQPVGDGKLNTKANQAVGYPCEHVVGSMGVFSILAKTAGPSETADKMMAEFKKRKITLSDAPGIGDRSFFSSPGYGMIQLNTFKGSTYLIITMLVPGSTETAQKKAARKLMLKALTKI